MNSSYRGRENWNYVPPLRQSQALLIAGGGGGAGHHNMGSHHGAGGGGGGWIGNNAHNSGGGGQTYGGWANTYSAGTPLNSGMPLHGGSGSNQATWHGGGGGGWFGGGGGAHTSSHYNGGSGGSGHHAMRNANAEFMPNSNLSEYIMYANTETSPSNHSSPWQYSAQQKNPLAYRAVGQTFDELNGLYAGKGGRGNNDLSGQNSTSNSRHGKIIITLMPQLLGEGYFDQMGVSNPNRTEWGIQDEYTEN